MSSTDYPFSITSKFIDASGAEHLVTVRAATITDFASRLQEAATVFPYAGFVPAPEPAVAGPEPTPITAPRPGAQAPTCPTHRRQMSASRYGGWYCPTKNQDGEYCSEKVAVAS